MYVLFILTKLLKLKVAVRMLICFPVGSGRRHIRMRTGIIFIPQKLSLLPATKPVWHIRKWPLSNLKVRSIGKVKKHSKSLLFLFATFLLYFPNAIEEGLNYSRRQGQGRRVGLGDRILAALAVLPWSF